MVERLRLRARLLLPVLDQALTSGGNFASGMIVARSLETEQFGVWVLATMLLWLAAPIHHGLLMQPLVVNGAGKDDQEFGYLLRSVLPLQLAFTLLCALAVAVSALLWVPVRPIGVPLVVALAALQGQDFCRRILCARGRLGSAAISNIVNYDLQAVALAAAALIGGLTLLGAMWIVAATSVLALIAAAGAVRPLLIGQGRNVRAAWRSTLRVGRWTASAELLHAVSVTAYPSVVGALAGLGAAAGYGVVAQVFGALNVLIKPIHSYFVPRGAEAWVRGGEPALGRVLREVWLVVAPPYVLFVALTLVAPTALLGTLYGERYTPYAGALQVFAVANLMDLLFHVFEVKAHALGRQRLLLLGQASGAVAVFALSAWLVPSLGLAGAGLVWIAAGGVRVLSVWLPFVARRPGIRGAVGAPAT
jgi:O-antigen/teichoic acid export membrane protein